MRCSPRIGRHAALATALLAAWLLWAHDAGGLVFSAPGHSTLEGKREAPDHFVLAGIEEECEEGFYEGAYYSRTLELVPVWWNCRAKALGGLPAKFILYGCAFLVRANDSTGRRGRWRASVDLTCRPTYSLRWQVYESQEKYEKAVTVCTTLMHPQKNIGTADVTDMRGRPHDITIHWHLDALKYETYGSNLFCGSREGVRQRGDTHYSGYTTVRATDLLEHRLSLAAKD